jgi:uncharacterized OsmC-like protein
MEIRVEYRGGVKFEASARGHRVVCDQPTGHGGSDGGMTPPEYLLVALGTCVGYYAAQFFKMRSLAADGLEVRVSAGKAASPARLDAFRVEITAPGLDPRHEDALLRTVNACLIKNTLLHAPAIKTVVHLGQPAAV